MKIGIIGHGMVGEALAFGFKRVGHKITIYDNDPEKGFTEYLPILDTELIFVCVPTPTVFEHCDRSIVHAVIADLAYEKYKGIVVIKSTVTPGTTDLLSKDYPDLRLAFCPEFLRERARFSDFVENQQVCVVGSRDVGISAIVGQAHGALAKSFKFVSPVEAELVKYFVNIYNAYRIVFANAFYDVCKRQGADYDLVKDVALKHINYAPSYLECNEDTRGFGGACLPKDTLAFETFVLGLGLPTRVFTTIVEENRRILANEDVA